MTSLVANRVQENSTLIGTGAITLAGATNLAMNTFASAFSNDALCGYIVLNLDVQAEWEQGIGTYAVGTNEIARTYVTAGSNGNAPVNFSAGAKIVLNALPTASVGVAYSAAQVYTPGDTVEDGGTIWYALAVSKGSQPVPGNANWTAMGTGVGSGTNLSVWLAVAQSIGNTGAPAIFDTKIYDTNNEYNTATGTFTALSAGMYIVNTGIFISGMGIGASETISVFVNGVENTRIFEIYVGAAGTNMAQGSTIVQLNAGDEVQIIVRSYPSTGSFGGTTAAFNYLRILRVQ